MKKIIFLFLFICLPITAEYYLPPETVIRETKTRFTKLTNQLESLKTEITKDRELINSNLPPYKGGDVVFSKDNYEFRYKGHMDKKIILSVNGKTITLPWNKVPDIACVRLGMTNGLKDKVYEKLNQVETIAKKIEEYKNGDIYFDGLWYSNERYNSLYSDYRESYPAIAKTEKEKSNAQEHKKKARILVISHVFKALKSNVGVVKGEIQNISNEILDFVKVEAWFVDKNDNVLLKRYVFLDPPTLQPNQRGKYEMYIKRPPGIYSSVVNYFSDAKMLPYKVKE